MAYIHRSIEAYLRKTDKTFKCGLVTGAGQTGKSTVLKELFGDKKYVTFDDPFVEEQAKSSRFRLLHHQAFQKTKSTAW